MVQQQVEMLTMDEAAKALRVSKSALYKWVAAGLIPYTKLGRVTRFDPVSLKRWLKQRSHEDSTNPGLGDEE